MYMEIVVGLSLRISKYIHDMAAGVGVLGGSTRDPQRLGGTLRPR
jgi:hypothetical protein